MDYIFGNSMGNSNTFLFGGVFSTLCAPFYMIHSDTYDLQMLSEKTILQSLQLTMSFTRMVSRLGLSLRTTSRPSTILSIS